MAGANRSLFETVTNLPASVDPLVVVTEDGVVAGLYRDAGIRVEILPIGGPMNTFGRALNRTSLPQRAWLAIRHLLPFYARLRRVIRRNRIDLVHINDPRGTLFGAPAAWLAWRPVIQHLRGEWPLGVLFRTYFELAGKRIIAVSQGALRSLSGTGQRRSRVVFNGIRNPVARSTRPFLRHLGDRGVVRIGCFASLVPFKGHHHLLEAIALVNAAGLANETAYFVIGDTPQGYDWYADWLQMRARELGIDNLTFAGWQDDPFAFYQDLDATVLASISRERVRLGERELDIQGTEGFPRTHLEAMTFGLPIVGTAIAGVPEQVADGETGLLVPPGDPQALARALEKVVRSPELRSRMGGAGRDRVERLFSTAVHVKGVLRVMEEVTGRKLSTL
jgi:glycosyltransferase involved in cell wall biosynthesis